MRLVMCVECDGTGVDFIEFVEREGYPNSRFGDADGYVERIEHDCPDCGGTGSAPDDTNARTIT